MADENVRTTRVKQPGRQEVREEIRVDVEEITIEAKGENRQEIGQEVKQEVRQEINLEVTGELRTAEACWRAARAEAIIHRNVLWALGAGILPFPIFDVVAVTAVQLKMLKELSDLYGVKFKKSLVKKILGSLLAGLGSVGLGILVGVGLIKVIPPLGITLGAVSVSVFAGAFTLATGRIFLKHFESGGTFLDFDPRTVRSRFNEEFERAKEEVTRMQKKSKTACDRAP